MFVLLEVCLLFNCRKAVLLLICSFVQVDSNDYDVTTFFPHKPKISANADKLLEHFMQLKQKVKAMMMTILQIALKVTWNGQQCR
jgi:hypothetical protein